MLLFKAVIFSFQLMISTTQADVTITDNVTFDIGNDFNNGFDLTGTRYDAGSVIAGKITISITGRYFSKF